VSDQDETDEDYLIESLASDISPSAFVRYARTEDEIEESKDVAFVGGDDVPDIVMIRIAKLLDIAPRDLAVRENSEDLEKVVRWATKEFQAQTLTDLQMGMRHALMRLPNPALGVTRLKQFVRIASLQKEMDLLHQEKQQAIGLG